MAFVRLLPPGVWALTLLTLVVLGYVLYQFRGYRLLRDHHRRLRDLRAGQRQVYRGLEALQDCCDAMLARIPHAVRPAPYAADDEAAIALRAGLLERLEELRGKVRPLEAGQLPGFSPILLVTNRYWQQLRAARNELAFARSLRRELAQAEALVDELESVLTHLAEKPRDAQRRFADVRAMADALGEEIELEQRVGTEGLAPLAFEAQAVRAAAADWIERLGKAGIAQAPQLAIEAEAVRPALLARLSELHSRMGSIAGIHDQALRALERLGAAIETLEGRLAGMRPALSEALEPALEELKVQHRALTARYDERDVGAYGDVSQRAWALVAQARALDRENARLAEIDGRVVSAVEGCGRGLVGLQEEMAGEQRASGVRLDLLQAALERLEHHMSDMQRLLSREASAGVGADVSLMMAILGEVEALAATFRQDLEEARADLETWQSQRVRVHEVLARLEESGADHRRLTRDWRALQAYARANWEQLEAGWYERYVQERKRILAAVAEVRAQMEAGRVAQSAGGELQASCEELDQRWQRLLHEGQRVTTALSLARAAQRQVQEAVAALRADVEAVAAVEQELPEDIPDAGEVRDLGRQVLNSFRELEEAARDAPQADLRRLRDEVIVRLHEQLAMHRLSYTQLMENERAALKRQLGALWEQWQPLGQRLARATPASDVDSQDLARRWEALVEAARTPPTGLRQVLGLQVEVDLLAQDVQSAQRAFQAEREAVRKAEVGLAAERRAAIQLRESLPKLLSHPHPQVVDEEWERSAKAWRKAESLVRRLEPKRGTDLYLARLADAEGQYREAHARARSALVRLLRYSFLEDPDGMHQVCLPMGRRWGRLGVTTREAHIRDLLGELEQAGQLAKLIDSVGSYFAGRKAT